MRKAISIEERRERDRLWYSRNRKNYKPRPESANRFTSEIWANIRSQYLDGFSSCVLSNKYGMARASINQHLRRRGIRLRSRGEHSKIYSLNQLAFDSTTPASAYWIGFMMTDGCVLRRKSKIKGISLSLKWVDKHHLEKFRDFLGSTHPIVRRANGGFSKTLGSTPRFLARLEISSIALAKSLIGRGVIPNKSFTASAPDDLLYNKDFWRGAIDGDGTIGLKTKNQYPYISLCSASEVFIRQFSVFAESLIPGWNGRIVEDKQMRRFTLHGKNAIALISYLYKDAEPYLDRKYALAKRVFDKADGDPLWCRRSRNDGFSPASNQACGVTSASTDVFSSGVI